MKRTIAALMTAILLLALAPSALAQSASFPDIYDPSLARDVAVLQMLGAVGGNDSGYFDPNGTLTRAAFCKMAVIVMGRGNEEYIYRNRTIFPDVRAGYWASGYINLAVNGEKKIIQGGSDGLFRPDDPITWGQAVTILMRILGYADADAGMLWPDGYIALAMDKGLTDDVGISDPGAPMTRALAAHLFCNLLGTEVKGGDAYITKLGTPTTGVVLMQLDVTASDGSKGAIMTSSGTLKTQSGILPAALLGLRGTLVKNPAGKVVTFLPDSTPMVSITVGSTGASWIKDTNGLTYDIRPACSVYTPSGTKAYSDVFLGIASGMLVTLFYGSDGSIESMFLNSVSSTDALIVGTDMTVNPLLPLTGYDTNAAIYKNGVKVSLSDISPYDVATYDKYSKVVQVSDFRLTGCYEKSAPSTSYPTSITLMGREFSVLPSAVKSLQAFKIGDIMTILLTADMQVAGAVRYGTLAQTAIGIVQSAGASSATVKLTNGLTFTGDPNLTADEAGSLSGELVVVSSSGAGKLSISPLRGGTTLGALNVAQKTLGTHQLSPYIRIYERVGSGPVAQIALSDLTQSVVNAEKIMYASLSSEGKVIMLVLDDVTGDRYTYGFLKVTGGESDGALRVSVVNGNNPNGTTPVIQTQNVSYGAVGGLAVACDGTSAEAVITLTEMRNVDKSDFFTQNGATYIRAYGRVIPVAKDVQCYNKANNYWFSSLDEVRASFSTVSVYFDHTVAEGGKIRVVVVG
jgi:hypothetical protein